LLQCHTYLLKYVFNCEEKFLIFTFWHCKWISEGLLYYNFLFNF
jgi:hypothetical protein